MRKNWLLIVDAVINLILGLLLLMFPTPVVRWLGVPASQPPFYASLLGAVFIGITIALVIEAVRNRTSELVGLGTGGAIVINLCGGLVLAVWLLSGRLALTLAGTITLWCVVVVLVGISSAETIAYYTRNRIK